MEASSACSFHGVTPLKIDASQVASGFWLLAPPGSDSVRAPGSPPSHPPAAVAGAATAQEIRMAASNNGLSIGGMNHGKVSADAGLDGDLVACSEGWQINRSSPRSGNLANGKCAHGGGAQNSSRPSVLDVEKESLTLQLRMGEHSNSQTQLEKANEVVSLGSDLTL